MKILYLIKDASGFTDTLKNVIETQIADGNSIMVINLYSENINYDSLVDTIFEYDSVICF